MSEMVQNAPVFDGHAWHNFRKVPVNHLDGMALAAAVAQEVMGWKVCPWEPSCWEPAASENLVTRRGWRPHDNANQAIRVLSTISDKHPDWWFWAEEDGENTDTGRYWRCGWARQGFLNSLFADGPTMPIAICRAALVAVRETEAGK